ncbi:MAG: hypothetical protein H6867_08320 [Rhodospirillales bacterium]|nr:hypothetical protein [Rhodospirillales bacterium]MCB9995561.1 hypothetical protein [Rhodospirillales bacterium]
MLKIKFWSIVFFLTTGFVLVQSGTVRAQMEQLNMSMEQIPMIQSYAAEMSQEDFIENSEIFEEEPLNDKHLAYRIRLPKKWHRVTSTMAPLSMDELGIPLKERPENTEVITPTILGEVARYYGPGRLGPLSHFEIETQKLEYEVTAKNWFMREILVQGYSLEGFKEISERKVEALYVVVKKDVAYVVRAVAEINGSRMVIASYHVPDTYWKAERAEQEYAISSFEFLSPEESKIEATRTYAFLDLLRFEYPASWRLIAPNIYNTEGMDAKLVHTIDHRTLSGEIDISILSNEYEDVLDDEVKFIKEELASRELELGEFIETLNGKYKFPPHVLYSHVEAYKLFSPYRKTQEHEFWLAIMEEDRYYYVVSMITPSRTREFFTWARNAEAFEVVVQSIKP